MKADVHAAIRRTLGKRHACYVLITCETPSSGGDMQVEMSYEGDPALASFLLQGAQNHIDSDSEIQEELCFPKS